MYNIDNAIVKLLKNHNLPSIFVENCKIRHTAPQNLERLRIFLDIHPNITSLNQNSLDKEEHSLACWLGNRKTKVQKNNGEMDKTEKAINKLLKARHIIW